MMIGNVFVYSLFVFNKTKTIFDKSFEMPLVDMFWKQLQQDCYFFMIIPATITSSSS